MGVKPGQYKSWRVVLRLLELFLLDGLWYYRILFVGVFGLLTLLSVVFCCAEVGARRAIPRPDYQLGVPQAQAPEIRRLDSAVVSIVGFLKADRETEVLGRFGLRAFVDSFMVVCLGATVGLGVYTPRTPVGRLVLLVAGCLGLLTFGMISGLALRAAEVAYHDVEGVRKPKKPAADYDRRG